MKVLIHMVFSPSDISGEMSHDNDKTVKPPVNWIGGKVKMANFIIKHMPEHRIYLELFGGSGAVLMAKPKSDIEIYNDLHKGVVNLYRVLRDKEKANELIGKLELTPYSREEFYNCRDGWEDEDNKIEKARKFMVSCLMAFSGTGASKHPSWSFSYNDGSGVKSFNKKVNKIMQVHERIKNVQIENKDAIKLVESIIDDENIDESEMLIYADPPYVQTTRSDSTSYKHDMKDTEQTKFCNIIDRFGGSVIISGYHNKTYNIILDDWDIVEHNIKTSAAPADTQDKGDKDRTEVLYLSPDIDDKPSFTGVEQRDMSDFID